MTRFLGGPVVLWHKIKKDYKDKTIAVGELEELSKNNHSRLEAYMLVASSNQKIFGDVMKRLQFTYQCGNGKYPKTAAQARDLLTGQLRAE